MEDLLTVDNYFNSLMAEDIACEEVNEVFEVILKEEENCRKENVNEYPQSNKIDNDLCMTEVYTMNESDFVSASCSTLDSHLPFLEKKENVFSTKDELATESVTRLYSPFAKIEDIQRKYKPRYKVFSSWSENFDSVLLQSVNKLDVHFKQFGNVDFSIRPSTRKILADSRSVSVDTVSVDTVSVDTVSVEEEIYSENVLDSSLKPRQELASENVTKLYSPFVKVEDSERKYKPIHKVFSLWPDNMDSVLLQSINKLVVNFKQFGNVDFFVKPPLKEIFIEPQSSSQSLKRTNTQALECRASKVTVYNNTKKARYNSSKKEGYNSILNSVLFGGLVEKQTEKDPLKTKAYGVFEDIPRKGENGREENVDKCPESYESDKENLSMTEICTLDESDFANAC